MQLKWMGRYRGLLEKLIKYCNVYTRCFNKEINTIEGVSFSFAQIQVVEYILENEELHQNMTEIANRLGIKQSQFSKLASKLVEKGLLEKYHTEDNKKSVIMQVSDFGKDIYNKYSKEILDTHFSLMFDKLDHLNQKSIDSFENFLGAPYLAQATCKEKKLVKIEHN